MDKICRVIQTVNIEYVDKITIFQFLTGFTTKSVYARCFMKFNSFYKHSNDIDHKQDITSLDNMCLS